MALQRSRFGTSPMYGASQTRGLPGLPPLPPSEKNPSYLYQVVVESSEHPPIMKGTSWTLAAPFKEQQYHRTPSESIANNYTPTASNLKLKDLPKSKVYKSALKSPRNVLANGYGELDEDEHIEQPQSRPLTPTQQLTIMKGIENEEALVTDTPTERDLERYYFYIQSGITDNMIAPQNGQVLETVKTMVPQEILSSRNKHHVALVEDLNSEIKTDYEFSGRKSVVDYILKDPKEKERLHIAWTPKAFPMRVIRAPVPWHEEYIQAKEFNTRHLFITNPMMLELQNLWNEQFSSLRFVNKEALLEAELPLLPSEFESLVKKQCWEAHEILRKSWIPTCAKLFIDEKDYWFHLVPQDDSSSTELAQEFFACVAAVMSTQLRGMVINSLADFLDFFCLHKEGNEFGDEFNEVQYVMKQVMILKLRVEDPKIVFDPTFRECRDIILRCFSEIIASGEGLQRVECELFPDMRHQRLLIRSVKLEESLVTDYMDKAMEIFKANIVGPHKYLNYYKKYQDLLNNKAELEITAFLKESHSLQGFKKKIGEYQDLRNEIMVLRITVPLSMFCLDCSDLNEELANRAKKLTTRLIQYCVDDNRDLNRGICRRYDEMSDRVNEMPDDTDALVALQVYLKDCIDVQVYKLKDEIIEAAHRLMFLLDYAIMPIEDIKLNSTVFHWPEHIMAVFELSQSRIGNRRETAEDELKKRVVKFEETLEGYYKEIEAFRKKEIIRDDEMKNNVETLTRLTTCLEQAREDLEQINKEEALLEFDQSQFPILQQMFTMKEPYDRLWSTALTFSEKSNEWLNGSFQKLNAEDIENDVQEMWRTMYKLTKSLSDQREPRKVADRTKQKIDKFKLHLPLLSTICNPGIRDRHWTQMSDIVGFDIKPSEETSLMQMLEYGLTKNLDRLEEIGAAAAKEFSLEKALEKMKFEWQDLLFEFLAYRDSGIHILAGVDDIQVLLDDHIVKAQTMRGSPFIKPFETEMIE